MMSPIALYTLFALSGVLAILPCVVTPILFPIYVVLAFLAVRVLVRNTQIRFEEMRPILCSIAFISIPQVLVACFWAFGFGENFMEYFWLITGASEFVLLIGFLTVLIAVRRSLQKMAAAMH